MEEALGLANGSVVDVFAVVASVGPLTPPPPPCSLYPLVTREICLIDSSRIGFLRIVSDYSQGTGLEFLEEEIHNKFLMATKVSENSDRGCPVDSDDTAITLVELGTSPSIAKLEAIRIELCTDVMSHDAVKRVIALREDWIKNLHSASRVSSGGASVRYIYHYLFWIRIVIVTISCQFSLD